MTFQMSICLSVPLKLGGFSDRSVQASVKPQAAAIPAAVPIMHRYYRKKMEHKIGYRQTNLDSEMLSIVVNQDLWDRLMSEATHVPLWVGLFLFACPSCAVFGNKRDVGIVAFVFCLQTGQVGRGWHTPCRGNFTK